MTVVYVAKSGPHCHLDDPYDGRRRFRRGHACNVAQRKGGPA